MTLNGFLDEWHVLACVTYEVACSIQARRDLIYGHSFRSSAQY
jgi:hypothetical protein